MKKIKNKKGAAEILEILITFSLVTFIIFFPIATYSLNQKKSMVEDTKTIGLQMLSRSGELTPAIRETIIKDLAGKGFNTDGVIIKASTDQTGISYRESNEPMRLEICVPAEKDVRLLKSLWQIVGKEYSTDDVFGDNPSKYYFYSNGYILSERLK